MYPVPSRPPPPSLMLMHLSLSTTTCGHSVFERTSEGEGILRSASPPLSPMLPPMMRLPHDCDGDGDDDAELEMEGRERDPQSER